MYLPVGPVSNYYEHGNLNQVSVIDLSQCLVEQPIVKDVARETGMREFQMLRAKIPANSRMRAASESAGMAIFARIPGRIPPNSRY